MRSTQRLNQNFLVGMGVMRHRQGSVELWYGATIPIWALVPRAIWPDKPAVGGSGDLVAEFTGISFAEGTSVGVGQVLEFYMNFGMTGVVAGFAILGFILMRLDQGITRALATGNIHGSGADGFAWVGTLAADGQSLRNACGGDFGNHCCATGCPLEIFGSVIRTEAECENVGTNDADDRSAMTRRFRVAIATAGRFHVLDLARELNALGYAVDFYSYVPKSRAVRFGLPSACHRSLRPVRAAGFGGGAVRSGGPTVRS